MASSIPILKFEKFIPDDASLSGIFATLTRHKNIEMIESGQIVESSMKTNYIVDIKKILPLSIICLVISGCGLSPFSERTLNPAIREWAWHMPNTTDMYATKASHRMFLVQTRGNSDPAKAGVDRETLTCAEPSPDVAEAVAEATANAFRLSLKEPNSGVNVDAQNQYAHTLATEIAPLLYRTQGLQLYRNAASDLCIDYMNGLIDKNTYQNIKTARFLVSALLIEKELEKIDKTAEAFYKNFKTSGPQFSISDVAKLANAFEGKEPKEQKESEESKEKPKEQTPTPTPTPPKINSLKPLVVEPTKEKITETNNTGTVGFNVLKMTDTSITFTVVEGADLASAVDSNGTVLTIESDKKSIKISRNTPVTLSLANLIMNRDATITVAGSPSGQKEVFKFPVVSGAQ